MAYNKIDSGPGILEKLGNNVASNFDGILSLKSMAKYLTGARCVVKINNKIAAFAFQISWNIQTTATEIRTVDDYMPWELAPKHVIVNGTIGALHIPGNGFFANSDAPLQSNVLNFLQQQYITIEVRDSQTDNLIFFTNKAMIVGRSEMYQAEQLGSVTLQWRAIGWRDEHTPLVPIETYPDKPTKSKNDTTQTGGGSNGGPWRRIPPGSSPAP